MLLVAKRAFTLRITLGLLKRISDPLFFSSVLRVETTVKEGPRRRLFSRTFFTFLSHTIMKKKRDLLGFIRKKKERKKGSKNISIYARSFAEKERHGSI